MTPSALHEELQVELQRLQRAGNAALSPDGSERLWLVREDSRVRELEPDGTVANTTEGVARFAQAWVEGAGVRGFAATSDVTPEGLQALLVAARAASRPAPSGPLRPRLGASLLERVNALGLLPLDACLGPARAVLAAVRTAGLSPQALLLTERHRVTLWLDGQGVARDVEHTAQALARVEHLAGPLVDGVATANPSGPWALEPFAARMRTARETLEGPGGLFDASLPFLLRPAVAAPLIGNLGALFSGEVAAAEAGWGRGFGKRIFPAAFSLHDEPRHPDAFRARTLDDEGHLAETVLLVDAGRLNAWLHTPSTARALEQAENGRAFRGRADGTGRSQPLNLFVVPQALTLPARYTELTTRLETFRTMPRAGVTSLRVAGFEVVGGVRQRRLAPFSLDLPILAVMRSLLGVGADLEFLAGSGCGTPSLLFSARNTG